MLPLNNMFSVSFIVIHSFTGEVGNSSETFCGPPGGLFHTIILNITKRVVEYTCVDGYSLEKGNLSRRCMSDGQWSGIAPVCVLQQPDLYVSMDDVYGRTLYGDGLTGKLVGQISQTSAGKVGDALTVHTARQQYVDFGNHIDNCLGNIAHCNEGLTISVWVKILGKGRVMTICGTAMSMHFC